MVIDDQVDSSADRVVWQVLHLDALVHDSLSSERSIAVNNNRNHSIAFVVRNKVLLGASSAHYHGIDRLQVRRVGEQRDFNWNFIWAILPMKCCTKMVLDIS